MQRSGTEAIRTQIQLKTKTGNNRKNTKRTYGQPSERLFSQAYVGTVQKPQIQVFS